MELFSKIFVIITSGIFLSMFMLLVEHPKRWIIGICIFGVIIILTIGSIPIALIVSYICPLFILLDVKRLSWIVCLKYLGVFALTGSIWAVLIVDYLPFYYYPILVLIYVLIVKAVSNKTSLKLDSTEDNL